MYCTLTGILRLMYKQSAIYSGVVVIPVDSAQYPDGQFNCLLLSIVLLDKDRNGLPVQRRGCLHVKALPGPGVVVDHKGHGVHSGVLHDSSASDTREVHKLPPDA